MTISVTAESICDARRQLGVRETQIKITWRDCNGWNYEKPPQLGVLVDATGVFSEEVTKSFPDRGDALAYIADLIKRHDEYLTTEFQKAKK